MPQFSKIEREQTIAMIMGGASSNAVARHLNVHRNKVKRFIRRLEETTLTRDRPYSDRPRVTTPKQDREIRITHIQNRCSRVVHTSGTIHGRHNPMISAKTGYDVCAKTLFGYEEPSLVPYVITEDSAYRLYYIFSCSK